MNTKLTNIFKSTRHFLGKHSPEILTGIGILGFVSTAILAVKSTPLALDLIEEKKERLGVKELKHVDMVKTTWKPYLPSVLLGIASTTCIVGASAVNHKRNAALAAAYSISERTLIRYRDKVIETLGEKKEKDIRNSISQDKVNENKPTNETILLTNKGNTLFMDSLSGRYFRSDLETIKKAINQMNRELTYQHYVSLNEVYGELGLKNVKNGDIMGWNLDSGLIEPDFNTCLADNDEPCIVIDYMVEPRYDFDKLM